MRLHWHFDMDVSIPWLANLHIEPLADGGAIDSKLNRSCCSIRLTGRNAVSFQVFGAIIRTLTFL